MKKILVLLILFLLPVFVSAESLYKEVKSIEELDGKERIVFVVDNNMFEFVDILKDPVSKRISYKDEYLLTDVGINNIFNIEDSSLSGDTLKIKPLVIGDMSVTCSKNTSCKKGNLYLKDDMFHYQDKEIKIQEISEGLFSVRSDNSHYLNYQDDNWIVGDNPQGIKIYKEVTGDNSKINTEYYMDDVLIIGQNSEDSINEKNESYVNIYLYYDKDDVKNIKLNYRYENSNTVDIKMKFIDMYKDNDYYDYLMNNEYLSSDYLLTRVYVTQDSGYSLITNNGINSNGGILDNILGESDVHIYVSSKYSTEYYKDKEILSIGSKDKYYINPDSYTIPNGYEESIDSKILESINYIDPKGVQKFVYNIELIDYESEINLPENELKYPWYINGKLVKDEFDVAVNLKEADNKIFKFTYYTKVENPNTLDNKSKFILIIILLIGIFVYSRKYKVN